MQKADISKFDPNGAGDSRSNIFGLNFTRNESNVILVPVPWEATTSYGRGTAKGPRAIRSASPQLDLFDAELAPFGLARPWEYGIHMEKESTWVRTKNQTACKLALPIVKCGGDIGTSKTLKSALDRVNTLSEELNDFVYKVTRKIIDEKKIAGVVGGDHSVPFGAIKAHSECYDNLGVLHIDAHADLRAAYEGFSYSHASIMHNVIHKIPGVSKLVQVGIRDFCDAEFQLARSHSKIKTFFDFELKSAQADGENWAHICARIVSELPRHVYISFDIDGLDPALCPHTGTPVPGGLSYAEAHILLKSVVVSGRTLVGFDLNEVAPGRSGEWDGNVGARLLYRLCGLSLLSRLRHG